MDLFCIKTMIGCGMEQYYILDYMFFHNLENATITWSHYH